MKAKYFIIAFVCLISVYLFAEDQSATPAKSQFMLIVRSKANAQLSKEVVSANIKHWQEFMGNLAQSGQLSSGFRPSNEGETISGAAKTEKKGCYVANQEMVSSFLIINADDMSKAKEIAAKCPVLELQGSVEIRPLQNTAK